jgi:hypothetical protein
VAVLRHMHEVDRHTAAAGTRARILLVTRIGHVTAAGTYELPSRVANHFPEAASSNAVRAVYFELHFHTAIVAATPPPRLRAMSQQVVTRITPSLVADISAQCVNPCFGLCPVMRSG